MKKLIIILFSPTLLYCSQKTSVQVFKVESQGLKQNDSFIFDNDSLRIQYEFWAENGIMSFEIYNKLNIPIYIDWNSSSFIFNDDKYNYWTDKEIVNSTTTYSSQTNYYNQSNNNKGNSGSGTANVFNPYKNNPFKITNGISNTNSVTIKPEKSTFIPPKSKIHKTTFSLFPFNYFKFPLNTKVILTENCLNKNKNEEKFNKTFQIDNTPIRFRNFISYTFKENSNTFYQIDNSFFIKEVSEIQASFFQNCLLPNQKQFFVNIQSGNDIKSRRNAVENYYFWEGAIVNFGENNEKGKLGKYVGRDSIFVNVFNENNENTETRKISIYDIND